jgi:flagellin
MSSLLTNSSSMVALQTLRTINSNLDSTNSRVSTGLRVGNASDSAAYWSIATTTKSDNGALGAVKDALGLGASTIDVMSTGLNETRKVLQQVKELLVTALQPGVDRAKVQTEITGRLDDIKNKASSTVINGQNWLDVDSSGADYNASKGIVASFTRVDGAVAVDTIDLDISAISMYDANGNIGIMDKDRTAGGTTIAVADIDVSALTDSSADLTSINEYIQVVDDALADITSASTTVGTVSTRIESQQSFVKALMDANERAIGTLVDADMEEESTKLKALQTQQQLAVQSLSIANSSSQNILSLFRN